MTGDQLMHGDGSVVFGDDLVEYATPQVLVLDELGIPCGQPPCSTWPVPGPCWTAPSGRTATECRAAAVPRAGRRRRRSTARKPFPCHTSPAASPETDSMPAPRGSRAGRLQDGGQQGLQVAMRRARLGVLGRDHRRYQGAGQGVGHGSGIKPRGIEFEIRGGESAVLRCGARGDMNGAAPFPMNIFGHIGQQSEMGKGSDDRDGLVDVDAVEEFCEFGAIDLRSVQDRKPQPSPEYPWRGNYPHDELQPETCLQPHGWKFHWPTSWASASLTSTSRPPTTGPGLDAVLTMRW